MKLVFLSDTHTFHDRISIPDGDFVIHSGDYSFTGNIPEVNKFLTWFSELPHPYKIFVNGNHEKMFWANPTLFESMIPRNVVFLLDRQVVINGLKFYGSPHTKEFGGWAYPYYTKGEAEAIWSKIPLDTDILVTHQPPYGIRDGVPWRVGREGLYVPSLELDGDPQGCEVLLEKVKAIKPKIHSFGHIHEGAGYSEIDGTLFVNASVCTAKYKAENPITVVTLDEFRQIKTVESVDSQKGYITVNKRG